MHRTIIVNPPGDDHRPEERQSPRPGWDERASSWIGRATALRFAEEGAKVVVSARGEPGLRSLVAEIEAAGGTATAVVADVTDPAQMQAVADRAVAAYGRLDTWVHMAGVLLVAGFDDTTPEEFARVLQVNLLGQVHGAKAALPHLRRQGGAFVSMSSMGSQRGLPLQTAYCSSKHGIDGFLEALRVELQRDDVPVSVTQIMPGTINTPLFDNARTKIGVKPVAPPPAYPARVVADAIVHAAAHPVRDLVVGGSAKSLITVEKFAPRLVDALLRRVGYELHDTASASPPTRRTTSTPAPRQRHRRGQRRRGDAAPQRLHVVGHAQAGSDHRPHACPPADPTSPRVTDRRSDGRGTTVKPAHRRGTPLTLGWRMARCVRGTFGWWDTMRDARQWRVRARRERSRTSPSRSWAGGPASWPGSAPTTPASTG